MASAFSMHTITLQPKEDFYDAARRVVVAGAPDGPVNFVRDGVTVASHPRLYRAAATEVYEEPMLHVGKWRPHYRASVSQRLLDVVTAEHALMKQERKK